MLALIAVVAVAFLLLAFWRFWFLRNPARHAPLGHALLSPADGRVISIVALGQEQVTMKKGLLGHVSAAAKGIGKSGYLISVFMSVFDVHVQRSPLAGRVVSVKHTKGRFIAANTLDALQNEKNEIVIQGRHRVKVIQVAGLIARRIECFVKPGQSVERGEPIGRINLGSQVCLVVPSGLKPLVYPGQKVRAGESLIAG